MSIHFFVHFYFIFPYISYPLYESIFVLVLQKISAAFFWQKAEFAIELE